jgi:hypothetical protein
MRIAGILVRLLSIKAFNRFGDSMRYMIRYQNNSLDTLERVGLVLPGGNWS